jgi:hypothetical protein
VWNTHPQLDAPIFHGARDRLAQLHVNRTTVITHLACRLIKRRKSIRELSPDHAAAPDDRVARLPAER